MKRKRLTAIGLISLVMTTGAGIAFGSTEALEKENPVTQVRQEIVISGPVKTETLTPRVIFKPEDPEVGSIEWMAKEKEEKERLRQEAIEKEAELQAEVDKLKAELEAEINRQAIIKENTEKLNEAIELVKAQVGISGWYHGGSSPPAWDCSGLVRWAYLRVGVDMRHSATSQRDFGTIITDPKPGDLVSFNHQGWRTAFHIGIYLGPDQMVHSGGKPGTKTEIRSISNWAKVNGNSEIVYTRIVETNN
jgi:cell wall-associated NlpC family hydrolase